MYNKLKKTTALFLIFILIIFTVGCSGKTQPENTSSQASETVSDSVTQSDDETKAEKSETTASSAEKNAVTAAKTAEQTRQANPAQNEKTANTPQTTAASAPQTSAAAQTTNSVTDKKNICTISIDCETVLNNKDKLSETALKIIPSTGLILPQTQYVIENESTTVFDVLKKVCRDNGIHLEFSYTPAYKSTYIEGIANLYERDCGSLSGWMYSVNGQYPNVGCSEVTVKNGDVIKWRYTCDLGWDVGAGEINQ